MPDTWEAEYLGTTDQGAEEDPDGDGVGNLREYNLGTDPGTADAFPTFMRDTALKLWLDAATGVTTDAAGAVSRSLRKDASERAMKVNLNKVPGVLSYYQL